MKKLYFMLAYSRRKAHRPLLEEVIENLTSDGFDVSTGVAESIVISPETLRVDADLYILKSHSSLWLNIAAVLDTQGARILNSYSSCVDTNNKIRAAARLSAAGVPVPRSWVTGDLAQILKVTDETNLLLKPNFGRNGDGIRIVRDRAELDTLQISDSTLVQELIAPVEEEFKLYVIGERVFAIRKHAETDFREPVNVEPDLEKIALRCGQGLGLEIYGVDVVINANGPFVVDVNYFPSFKGVAGAAGPLTDHIREFARERTGAA